MTAWSGGPVPHAQGPLEQRARVLRMATPPALSPEQREAALQKAAEARKAFAVTKEKLKMGSLTLGEALDRADSEDAIGRLKVVTFLESLPGVGKVKARQTMERIGIAENRRVKGLGEQQRQALREQLG